MGTKKEEKRVYNLQKNRLAWEKKWYVLQNFWDLSEKWNFKTEYFWIILVEASTDLVFAPISDFNIIYLS